jgi:hypothetical protein
LLIQVATLRLDTGEFLYSLHVDFTQWVATLRSPQRTLDAAIPVPATTWSADHIFGISPAGHIGPDVTGAVMKMVDDFIDAFRKANPSETVFHLGKGQAR